MRNLWLLVILSMVIAGCAHAVYGPTAPVIGNGPNQTLLNSNQSSESPYKLFGEWKIFIDAAHDRVEVVPRREGRFHLNALKFLEQYCTDCLKIDKLTNNGDGTVDLTVTIKHPFANHPEFTGFDVKGIIIFNGSHLMTTGNGATYWLELPPDQFRVSWRELGDPQVLNPDGYVRRWSLSYDSGSDLPMFNYWKGKHANGEPNADVNAYLNFCSTEERHMFAVDAKVTRTYKLWLPPGEPIVAGYAVEACWEPPTVTPVKDPLNDFPSSANQPEAYYVKWVLNNGEPLKYNGDCCEGNGDCSDLWVEIKQWGGVTTDYFRMFDDKINGNVGYYNQCQPPQDGIYSPSFGYYNASPGNHQWICAQARQLQYPEYGLKDFSYTMLEFQIIE